MFCPKVAEKLMLPIERARVVAAEHLHSKVVAGRGWVVELNNDQI